MPDNAKTQDDNRQKSAAPASQIKKDELKKPAKEYGGPKGQDPTRYGDWEKKGRCIDF